MEPQVTEIPVAEALTGGPLISKAPSPSGKAEVCKTSTPGSNPGGASKFLKKNERDRQPRGCLSA
jgi:hypothetical protein